MVSTVRAIAIVAVLVTAACRPADPIASLPGPTDAVLRSRFASHAPVVLAEGQPAPTLAADGFVHPDRPFSLPRFGDGALRLGGILVTEQGAAGPARALAGAIAYQRSNGTAFWSLTGGGFEEWLLVEARPGEPVARWTVEGGSARKVGRAVLLSDAEGVPRVTVSAPHAVAENGDAVTVRLEAEGAELTAWVEVSGLVLVDPYWTSAGSLTYGRMSGPLTQLPDGRLLLAGGNTGSSYRLQCELYDPDLGGWRVTASLPAATGSSAAVLLRNGKVLSVGNRLGYLFDPEAETWTATGPTYANFGHTATLLRDGRVLVAGGTGGAPTTQTQIFDPATNLFQAAAPLPQARSDHAAALLPDGRVLVAGGSTFPTPPLATAAYVYNPLTNTWSNGGSMSSQRSGATATALPNGQVLVVGGQNGGTYLQTAQRWSSGAWLSAGGISYGRSSHLATLLPNGTVAIIGGDQGGAPLPFPVEIYYPASNTWAVSALPVTPRKNPSVTLLHNGMVMMATGAYFAGSFWQMYTTAELFDPRVSTFTATGAAGPIPPTAEHSSTPLLDGRVLIAGGVGAGGVTPAAWLYDRDAGTYTATGPLAEARTLHTATLLPSGRVLIAGGRSGTEPLATAELYDLTAGAFTPAAPMATARQWHSATLLASGSVMVAGGLGLDAGLASAEVFDPADGGWSDGGTLGGPRYLHTATALPSSKVLIAGGRNDTAALGTAELFDPSFSTWTPTGSLSVARHSHAAAALASGRVLIAGGRSSVVGSAQVSSAELYNPDAGTFTSGQSMAVAKGPLTMSLLPGGEVLATGPSPQTMAERYDPQSGRWVDGGIHQARGATGVSLLPSGELLFSGGRDGTGLIAGSQLYDEGRGASAAWSPVLAGPLPATVAGGTLAVAGTLFTGRSEASGGRGGQSATNAPLLRLMPLSDGRPGFARATTWTDTAATFVLPDLLPGPYVAWVVVNGVLSNGVPLRLTAVAGGPGATCLGAFQCASGYCVDGVCCDGPCGGQSSSDCLACSVAAGAAANGTCGPVASGRVCRAAASTCDVAESCDGASAACPTDGFASASVVCRPAAGACDIADGCTGTDSTCSADVRRPPGTVCRPDAGLCDLAETCTGTAVCPIDVRMPAGTLCRPPADLCDVAESCTGGAACPVDRFASTAVVCRPASGACDVAESCDGGAPVCPADAARPNGDPCTDSNACTSPDTCQAGACAPGTPVTCAPLDECHDPGVCLAASGCPNPPKADGTPCSIGLCVGGTCTPVPDAGAPDAGAPDAGAPDAGAPDAGAPDAGAPDAGAPDAGAPDAGAPDAGAPDAGAPDAGAPDAGAPDAGAPDAGPTDAGTPDAGPLPDAGDVDAGAADAGAPDAGVQDGGPVDAGEPDAGAADGGSPPVEVGGGCGCSTGGELWLGVLLLAGLLRPARTVQARRRRAHSPCTPRRRIIC